MGKMTEGLLRDVTPVQYERDRGIRRRLPHQPGERFVVGAGAHQSPCRCRLCLRRIAGEGLAQRAPCVPRHSHSAGGVARPALPRSSCRSSAMRASSGDRRASSPVTRHSGASMKMALMTSWRHAVSSK
jgi:hypothetical protein